MGHKQTVFNSPTVLCRLKEFNFVTIVWLHQQKPCHCTYTVTPAPFWPCQTWDYCIQPLLLHRALEQVLLVQGWCWICETGPLLLKSHAQSPKEQSVGSQYPEQIWEGEQWASANKTVCNQAVSIQMGLFAHSASLLVTCFITSLTMQDPSSFCACGGGTSLISLSSSSRHIMLLTC